MSARKSWAQEMESVYLYEVLAESDASPERRALFAKLAGEARGAGGHLGGGSPEGCGGIAGRVPPLGACPVGGGAGPPVRCPARLRGVLAGMKVRGMSVFRPMPVPGPGGHAMPHSVEEIGRRHRAAGGRRHPAPGRVRRQRRAGLEPLPHPGRRGRQRRAATRCWSPASPGLLAGAFSMAAGEYVSVRSQREMFEHQIGAERDELRRVPGAGGGGAVAHLPGARPHQGGRRQDGQPPHRQPGAGAGHAGARGAGPRPGVARLAVRGGRGRRSPRSRSARRCRWRRSCSPAGRSALGASVALTAAALFGIGCAISLFTGRGALRSGTRMLVVGGAGRRGHLSRSAGCSARVGGLSAGRLGAAARRC